MEYKHTYDDQTGVCTVSVFGEHRRPDDSIELQQFARSFREENGCGRFLFDMTEAHITGVNMDMYKIAIEPGNQGFDRDDFKVALLHSGDISEQKFMETVLVNRGYDFRIFNNIRKAYDWLTRIPSST